MPTLALANQRICITGGAGFLGSFVVERLRAAGVPDALLFVPRRAAYDLTREADVERLYRDARPDVVIHLAAEVGGIGANRSRPGRFCYANLAMGLHVVEHARRAGVRKLVQVGTVCAYPRDTRVPFREEDLWDGYPEETNAPYGVAKKTLLVLCRAYRQQYGLSAIYLLPTNLYGPRDNFDPQTSHVIPALIRRMDEARAAGAESVTLWGDGTPTREFLYVADAADGIVAATAQYDGAEPVNLGSGQETSIADLARRIAELVGYTGQIRWDTTQPNGQPRRCLDTMRARAAFGFAAHTSLTDGLKRTIAWYREETAAG